MPDDVFPLCNSPSVRAMPGGCGWLSRTGCGKSGCDYILTSFTFLGFTFRARRAIDRDGERFTAFLPVISKEALKRVSGEVRRSRLHRQVGRTFAELARAINPIVRGWMQYYGAFYRTALYPFLRRINAYLIRWSRKKFKRLRTFKKAHACWRRITRQYPRALAHWAWVPTFW
jgi:hypothetical protein